MNRLADTESLYLRKHAENPIAWWPWCEEALETAHREDKPIFLSIGYSSCHWCTVMEGEAFSDSAIAEYLNANFLPIKVDREERPDLDSVYMQALQMMVGQGGWPLNVFLTPSDRIPFYGGTYFPVEPRYGRPGFLQVLQAMRRYYDSEKEKLQAVTSEIIGNLRTMAVLQSGDRLSAELLRQGLEYSTGVLLSDAPGTRFPMIPYAEAALRLTRQAIAVADDALQGCRQRGLNLAMGGIFDHVGGGFHRYTVDPTWTVPHFEKMLYDNGQILEFLANLWSAGVQEPAIERAIARSVQWLQREMTAAEGYFYAAQDADSFAHATEDEPEEGAFYVWSDAELAEIVTAEELAELAQEFTLTEAGNFEGVNVLQRRQSDRLSGSVEVALEKLFTVRYGSPSAELPTFPPARNNQEAKRTDWPGRIPCVTDTKMIVAWNSLMISGLARASSVFDRPDYRVLASSAVQFILDHQWRDDRLHRVNYDGKPEVLAQSEDYALLVKALLDLHQADLHQADLHQADLSQGDRWLQAAVRVQAEFDEFLWSLELGGYYNTDARADLLVRERSYVDSATPAANAIAAANLVRLALLTEDLSHLDRADQTVQAFSHVMEKSPQACPSLFSALDWLQNHTLIRSTPDRLTSLVGQYLPTVVCKQESELPDGAIALVCQGLSCQEPARTPDQLHTQIQQSQRRG